MALAALLWRADRRLVLWLATFSLALGVLPNLIVVSTGGFAGSSAAAVRAGLDSPAGRESLVALGLLGGCFALNGVLMALVRWVTELLNTAYVNQFTVDVGRAYLSPRYVDVLEQPAVADELSSLGDFERSGLFLQAVPALRMVVSRRLFGIGAAVILVGLAWWAPLVMLVGWQVARWTSSRWTLHGFDAARAGDGSQLRRADYLRSLAMGSGPAKEVRLFGLARWVTDQYSATWRQAMATVWAARRASSRDLVLGVATLVVAHVAVFGWLGWQASMGRIGVGTAVTLGMAVLGTADLGFLGDQEWRVTRAGQLARQLRALSTRLHAEPSAVLDPADTSLSAPLIPLDSTGRGTAIDVTLRGVSFGYRRGAQVLTDLELHIPAGQSIAVVGANGAGKSTLLKLLCGLYEPQAGRISIDGRDLRRVDPSFLQRRIGMILQDFVRYELPLSDNVGFGGMAVAHDEAQLAGALRDAGGDDLVGMLSRGWETVLSPAYYGGADLSGGEWQKVALARALTAVRAGAGMLILDEPTASLDVRAEAELFDRFLDVTRGVTTILVSHRLSGVRRADRIVVLDGGRIVEDGNHEDLLGLGGRYAAMFRLQAERFSRTPRAGDQGERGGHA